MADELRLRKLKDRDVPLFKKWLSEDHIARWYQDPPAWIEEIENRHGQFNWIRHYIAVLGGQDIGFGQFYEYKYGGENWHKDIEPEGACSIDYLIGEKEHLGKGLGSGIVRLLAHAVFALPEAQRIIVRPDPGNKASCRALLSAGFLFDQSNRLYRLERSARG